MRTLAANAFLAAAALVLLEGVAAASEKCPHPVSFASLPVPRTQTVETDWVEPEAAQAEFTLPDFFARSDGLTVKCVPSLVDGRHVRSLGLARGSDTLATFTELPYFGLLCGRQAVHLADYDGNQRTDLKFVVYMGGSGGNANNGKVYYLFQHEREWQLVSYFIRDVSYAWECDLNGDGRFELVRGHHQDKDKPGYHDRKTDRWVGRVFRKYLIINAYEIGPNGLTLRNDLSDRFPMILPFTTDPFAATQDKEFVAFNQFKLPHDYCFKRSPKRHR